MSEHRTRHQAGRGEIDPPEVTEPLVQTEAPPEGAAQVHVDDPEVQQRVRALIDETAGGLADKTDVRLTAELVTAALKLIPDGRDTGELKLMTAAIKELRHAYRIFGQYPDNHKVTIFGSARTPPDHPDYESAVRFSRLMASAGWMVITGAGDGIMRAGHEGPGRDASFGVAIRLPFETTANEVIAGDEKLVHFRYFFTRKVMFLSQAEAVVIFPGGFGTMDEIFETLTLVQTGKAPTVPIVLVEGHKAPGSYWDRFESFVRQDLLGGGFISSEDLGLMYRARDAVDAAEHVIAFYRVYHSCRYVRDDFVIRIKRPLPESYLERLNDEFAVLVKRGKIVQRGPLELERGEHPELTRLVFEHTRYKFGLIRRLIDRINDAPEA
ncbi:MAG: LOG family protein [Planctomycetota bacterium]